MKWVKSYSLYFALFVAFVTAFFFQNCGKGFQPAKTDIGLGSSAQCMIKLREKTALMKIDTDKLQCEEMTSYVCERRVFRPGVGNGRYNDKECSVDKSVCVDVLTYMFDTEVARKSDGDSVEFNEGGEYNREDIKCNYRYAYRGLSPFEGQGNTIEESLQGAMAACHRAKGGG